MVRNKMKKILYGFSFHSDYIFFDKEGAPKSLDIAEVDKYHREILETFSSGLFDKDTGNVRRVIIYDAETDEVLSDTVEFNPDMDEQIMLDKLAEICYSKHPIK